MIDWMNDRQKSAALRKAEEEAEIAAFIAQGKVKNLGYSDEKRMKNIQRNWGRNTSPTEIEKKKEEDKFCIFPKNERF
jgi:hypothetical protein